MSERIYHLNLTVNTGDDPLLDSDVLDDIVTKVIEWSTAREAIETGLDAAGVPFESVSLGMTLSDRTCKACGAALYGLVRVHHHSEDGQDAT